ncbi:tetratricopeptide repeat protein [Flammeovirga pectinis]|uniref:Tetratricopeptide repeat protein n=2 Tax=Flammeovirga pectinis TaxID=2494373 RepID=A0A3Q9FPT7_9BACT|nr:tetratricopeptide repeat protein [Flammeovirga pectinis]
MSFLMNYLYTLLFSILVSASVFAQNNGGKTESDKYNYAKELIDQGKYAPGIVVLEDVLSMKGATLQPYALTLIGYADYQQKKYTEAETTLLKVTSTYPSWEQLDNANYLLACSYLKQGKVKETVGMFDKIKDQSLKDELTLLSKDAAQGLSYEEIYKVYTAYPTNEMVGFVLLEKIKEQPKEQRDQELYQKLATGLGVSIDAVHKVREGKFKEVYTIATILPFFTETIDGDALRVKNEFVYNIYQGILLGKEYLEKRDVKVNILAFDTKRDTTHLQELLAKPEMENVDLIIGPLYADMLPIVQQYSNETGVPMVNPISNNSSIIEGVSSAFLVTSTPYTVGSTLGKKLRAQELQALEMFEVDSLKLQADTVQTYVVFGHSTKEKELAKSFKEAYEAEGGKIAAFQEFDPVDGFNVLQEMFDPLAYVDSLEIVKDSTANVFIAVTNEIEALNTISALLSLGTVATTYVPEEWLKFKQLSYAQMESAKINILFPNWYNDDSYRAKSLIAEYQAKFNNQPSDFVFKGFETIFSFGMILKEYGSGFVTPLKESEALRKGYLVPAYNYFEGQDNQYVPIIQFIDGDLKNMTPPEFIEEN